MASWADLREWDRLDKPYSTKGEKSYQIIYRDLTHLPLVPLICVSESGQHWFTYSAPSHYLHQCSNIVNWTLGTKFSEILIKIYTFSFTGNIVCVMASILSRGRWVNVHLGNMTSDRVEVCIVLTSSSASATSCAVKCIPICIVISGWFCTNSYLAHITTELTYIRCVF